MVLVMIPHRVPHLHLEVVLGLRGVLVLLSITQTVGVLPLVVIASRLIHLEAGRRRILESATTKYLLLNLTL